MQEQLVEKWFLHISKSLSIGPRNYYNYFNGAVLTLIVDVVISWVHSFTLISVRTFLMLKTLNSLQPKVNILIPSTN